MCKHKGTCSHPASTTTSVTTLVLLRGNQGELAPHEYSGDVRTDLPHLKRHIGIKPGMAWAAGLLVDGKPIICSSGDTKLEQKLRERLTPRKPALVS